jgi:hypothetical protein
MSTLVLALVPLVRDRILPGLPKPLLMVIVGISLSVNLALFFYVARLRKSRKQLTEQRDTAQTFIKKFTVKWDEQGEPHCPNCLSELVPVIHPVSGIPDPGFFKCIPCKHGYRLTNEVTNQFLTLAEAKKLLTSNESLLAVETPLPTNIKLKQAIIRLESFDNLPKGDVEQKYVMDYNSILDTIQQEIGHDLGDFYIPLNELQRHIAAQYRDDYGALTEVEYTRQSYCDRAMFDMKYKAAKSFIMPYVPID